MNKKQILIVDDDIGLLYALERGTNIYHPNYQVVTATNGIMALNHLRMQSFDLMVTDYKMPGMNGLDLAQTTRQISPTTHIVLMSGNPDSLKDSVSRLHLDGYLEKPFEWQEFEVALLA
jgi:YesN/AraC family two-component response regulator